MFSSIKSWCKSPLSTFLRSMGQLLSFFSHSNMHCNWQKFDVHKDQFQPPWIISTNLEPQRSNHNDVKRLSKSTILPFYKNCAHMVPDVVLEKLPGKWSSRGAYWLQRGSENTCKYPELKKLTDECFKVMPSFKRLCPVWLWLTMVYL